MKKIISLILALMLIVSLSVTAFAVEAETQRGTIEISGVSTSTSYAIYKLLHLDSYQLTDPSSQSGAYAYMPESEWLAFFESLEIRKYFTVETVTEELKYVTWTWTVDPNDENSEKTEDEAIAKFAKLALAYAKGHDIQPIMTSSSTTNGVNDFVITGTTGKFSDLDLGYYLVDSSAGALCGLTTTNPDAKIQAKNIAPTIDKMVKEDSTGQFIDTSSTALNTADIGQIVEYRVTIDVKPGAENYVLHDKMDPGLTFKHEPPATTVDDEGGEDPNQPMDGEWFRGVWKVEHLIPSTNGSHDTHPVDEQYYEVKWNSSTNSTNVTDGCTFEVVFYPEFHEKISSNDKIIIYYNAMLNRNACLTNTGNANEAWLTFGQTGESNHDKVHTHTFSVDIIKTDSDDNLLDGAKFKIYDAAIGGNEVAVVILEARCEEGNTNYLTDSLGNPLMFDHDNNPETAPIQITHITKYRRARPDETGVEIIVQNGRIEVVGFDNGTYYLEETEAPDGYTELATRKPFTISGENLSANFPNGIYSAGSGIHVVNKSGSRLPETGAMGTMLFITFGTVVVMATGVLLVTKKRMSMIEE